MPSTYTPIATITASGSVSDVEFTSIPSTYTDLILIVNGRTANSVTDQTIQIYLNNDFNTLYSYTILDGNGSSAYSSRQTNQTGAKIGQLPGASSSAGAFGNTILQLMNYSNTTTNKSFISRGNNTTGTLNAIAGLYRSTSAITRVGIATYGAGNYVSGSTFTLYGVKSA